MKRILSTSLLVAALLPLSAIAGQYYTFTQNTGVFTTTTGLSHGQAVTWGLGSSLDGSQYTNLYNDINVSNRKVSSATLTLTGIYDWTNETNDSADALYIHILANLNVPTSNGISSKYFDNASPATNTSWANDVDPFVDNTTASSYNNRLQTTGQAGYTGTALQFQDAVAGSLLKSTDADQALNQGIGAVPSTISWSDRSGTVPSTVVITFTGANLAVLNNLLDLDGGSGAPNVGLGFAAECHFYMTSATLQINVPDSGSTIALMGLGLLAVAAVRRSKK